MWSEESDGGSTHVHNMLHSVVCCCCVGRCILPEIRSRQHAVPARLPQALKQLRLAPANTEESTNASANAGVTLTAEAKRRCE